MKKNPKRQHSPKQLQQIAEWLQHNEPQKLPYLGPVPDPLPEPSPEAVKPPLTAAEKRAKEIMQREARQAGEATRKRVEEHIREEAKAFKAAMRAKGFG